MAEEEELALLMRMEAHGVKFYIEVPPETYFLSAKEALELARNPDMMMLKLFDCTRADVEEWRACYGTVECHGTTKAGKPCKGVVRNAVSPISEWLRLKRERAVCHVHGGS